SGLGALVVSVSIMFSPLLGTIAAQRLNGERIFQDLGATPVWSGWLLAAPLFALGMMGAGVAVSALFPGVSFDPSVDTILALAGDRLSPEALAAARQQLEALPVHPAWLAIPSGIAAGMTLNALAAFGEEIGWRGLLFRELRDRGFWTSSWIVGLLWGLWHAPLILLGHNYPDDPIRGILLFTVYCVLMSPLYTWIRDRSRSVWGAAFLHGTFNGLAGIPMLVIIGGSALLTAPTGLASVLAMGILNLILWIAVRPALHHDAARSRAAM
ncbi:MAG: CPBP family intramembrane glutamic endopeptidase, partial [Myxococcota bacterium]